MRKGHLISIKNTLLLLLYKLTLETEKENFTVEGI